MPISNLQTSTLPSFNFPREMQWLYENGFDLEFEKIGAILALDRELLISDLISILNDSIVRHEIIIKKAETQGYNEENFNFPCHALLLLSELKAENALDQILEVLKQDQDFLDFWFGEFLLSFGLPVIFRCGLNQIEKLFKFLQLPNTTFHGKSYVSGAVIRIPAIFPERKPEILNWSRELLISNANSNDFALDDILYHGFLLVDVTNAGFHELLPEIKHMFDSESIAVHICGDYEEISEDITIPDYQYFDQLENGIFENYAYLIEELDDFEIENEDDFSEGLFKDSQFLNDALIISFGIEKRSIGISPNDGLIIDYWEE